MSGKRYRVIGENVKVATAFDGEMLAAEPGWIWFDRDDQIPRDLAKRAKQAKLMLTELPARSLESLLINEFVEEIG